MKEKNSAQLAKRLLPVSAFLLTPFALADTHQIENTQLQSYQSEINVGYEYLDFEYDSVNAHHTSLRAIHYFSPLDVTDVPLAEAAFLNRASSVSIAYQYDDYEAPAQDLENKYRSLDVNYYVPNTMFFAGAGLRQDKSEGYYDYGGYGSYDYETDWETDWVGRLGVAPVDGLLIWSEFYEHVKVSDYWNLNAKYVKPLSSGRAFGIESSYQNAGSDVHQLHVIGDYYFSNKFSVGLGILHYEADNYEDKDILLRTRYFLTDKISLDLTYTDQNYRDTWRLGASARF